MDGLIVVALTLLAMCVAVLSFLVWLAKHPINTGDDEELHDERDTRRRF